MFMLEEKKNDGLIIHSEINGMKQNMQSTFYLYSICLLIGTPNRSKEPEPTRKIRLRN
jgi:hypothetical protein